MYAIGKILKVQNRASTLKHSIFSLTCIKIVAFPERRFSFSFPEGSLAWPESSGT
jgi:hypothetical protein